MGWWFPAVVIIVSGTVGCMAYAYMKRHDKLG